MIATDTGAALLRAIVDHPQDDDVRLVYADWLDDQGDVPRRCERCLGHGVISIDQNPCPDCGGKGSLPGPNAARAEFIRVQVELACTPPCSAEVAGRWAADRAQITCPRCALRCRERALLGLHGEEWVRSIALALGLKRWGNAGITCGPNDPQAGTDWEFRRGFPAALTCRAIAWWGEPGRPGHGPALVRAAPIERVEISDREALVTHQPPQAWWAWGRNEAVIRDISCCLPYPIYQFVDGWEHQDGAGNRIYTTPEAARAALSTAALAWARLPPCGECEGEGWHYWEGASALEIHRDHCRPCHGLGRAERLDRNAPQG